MPIYQYECPDGHEFEKLVKMGTEEVPCQAEACTKKAHQVLAIRTFDNLGPEANKSSVLLHFNWIP